MCTSISVSLAYPTFICCHCNVNKHSCLYNCHYHTVCKNHHHASNHNPPLENPSSHSSPRPYRPSILETEGQVLVCSSTRDSAPCPSWGSINRYWFSDIQSVVSRKNTLLSCLLMAPTGVSKLPAGPKAEWVQSL